MLYRKKFYIMKGREGNTAGHLKFEINSNTLRVEIFPCVAFFGQNLILYSWSEKEKNIPYLISEIRNKNVFSVYQNPKADIDNIDTFFIRSNDRILYYASGNDSFMPDDSIFNQPPLEDDLGYFFVEQKNILNIDKRLICDDLISLVKYYGYYIFGENRKNKALTALGIPAYFDTDPHPFYKYRLCSIWEPEAGAKTEFGDFGYWIVGVNRENDEIFPICI